MTTVYLETLGCEKNRVDTEIMMGSLVEAGFSLVSEPRDAQVIVINTCGFITAAVNESIDRILALADYKTRENDVKLIVVGCMVERYKDGLMKEIEEIDALAGASDYTLIPEVVASVIKKPSNPPPALKKVEYSENNYQKNRIQTRPFAYLKIAEGCSNQCSFCLIPRIRGRYKSKPDEIVLKEFSAILETGIKEINLISQDCSSYGLDISGQTGLVGLARKILERDSSDFWLRLFYLYPNQFPIQIIELMNEDHRLTPYVDIPIQHISDRVLTDMRRNITGVEIERLLDRLLELRSDLAIRTTLMVGFPGETDNEFIEIENLVKKGYFTHLGVFEYSPEEKTVASRLEDSVSADVKKERRERIMEAQQSVSYRKNKAMIGQKQKVLLEGEYEETELLLKGRNRYQGAEVDGVVLINEGSGEVGEFCQVEITEAHPYDIIGRILP